MQDLLQFGSPRLTDLLSPELNAELNGLATRVRYRDGELIHERGDDKPGISIVHSGTVRVGNVGSDGSFLTTSIFGPGQCFGEFTVFAGLPRTHNVTAIGDCSIDQIPGPRFKRLFDARPELAKALLTVWLIRSHGLLEFYDDYRRLPLPVHMAKFLLSLSAAARDPDEIHCRQEDLAFTFGLSRVSVGKALKQLEKEKLIALGYGKIRLPDRARLARWVAARNVILPLEPRAPAQLR